MDDEPLFPSMETEELDYGPSWGLIIFVIVLGFASVAMIFAII